MDTPPPTPGQRTARRTSSRPRAGSPTGSGPAPGHPARRPADPFRWIVEHPGVMDAIVCGGIAAVLVLIAPLTLGSPGSGSATGWGWMIFSVPMFAAGAFLRTRTAWATLAIGVLAVLHFACGLQVILGDVMIFYALFCATVHGSVRTRRLALASAFLGAFLQAAYTAVWLVSGSEGILGAGIAGAAMMFFGSITVLGTWAVGRYQHARVDQLRLARERADQAEREREQRAALAVADERARIAREMHDVVAHSLSVIIAQADGGRFVATQNPEAAVGVLETIATTGRSALADMRGLLGVLRRDERSGEDESFGPQPDLSSLPALLERVRAAGLPVREDIAPDLGDLPPALGLSMFRLVQEALTNVMKHAGPGASALVRVHRNARELVIDVIDDGRGVDPASDGQGHGLTGMRERVALYGGTVIAQPLPAGGFRVSARVPLRPADASAQVTAAQHRAGADPRAAPSVGAPAAARPRPPISDPYRPHEPAPERMSP